MMGTRFGSAGGALIAIGALLLPPPPAAGQVDVQMARAWMSYDAGGDATFGGLRLGAGWWPASWLRLGADVERWGDLDGVSALAGHVSLTAAATPFPHLDLYTTWALGAIRSGETPLGTRPLDGRSTRVTVGAALGPSERYRLFGEVGLREDDGANDPELALGGRVVFGARPAGGDGSGGGQFTVGVAGLVALDGPYSAEEPVYSMGWRQSPTRVTGAYADAALLHVDGRGYDTRALWIGAGVERRLVRGGLVLAPAAGVGLLVFPEGADQIQNFGFSLGAVAQTSGRGIDVGLRSQALIVPLQSGGTQASLLVGGFVALGR